MTQKTASNDNAIAQQMTCADLSEAVFTSMRADPVVYLKKWTAQQRDEHRQQLDRSIVNSPEMHYQRMMHESFSLMILHLEGRLQP